MSIRLHGALLEALRALVAEVVREELAKVRAERDDYLSTRCAAEIADVAQGTILGYHAGRSVRVRRSELERLLRSGGDTDNMTPEQLAARDFR